MTTNNLLITYITGIGNTVLFIPTLRLLRVKFPDSYITVCVRWKASKDILDYSGYVNDVRVINPDNGFVKTMREIFKLRRVHFDISITPFTLNRLGFNLMSFIMGARRRIGVKYSVGYWQTLSFLYTDLVDAVIGMHEIDQNLELLKPLKILPDKNDRKLSLILDNDHRKYAHIFLKKNNILNSDICIGIHPGSIGIKGDLLRRWPENNYSEVGRKLIMRHGVKILLFGTTNEIDLLNRINVLMDNKATIINNTSILQSTAIISKCHLFIANDSGPMHLSVAVDTPTLSIWGPSDHIRAGHESEKHTIIRLDLDCSPCKKYPHHQYGGSEFDCKYKGNKYGECMTLIDVDMLIDVIEDKYAHTLC